jgi:predicted outer membrane repeat protein
MVLLISCVSANELNDTDSSDFDDLSTQINSTPENQTVNLEKDYQLSDNSQKHIVIDKSMTIDGNDHTISAPDTERVFWVKADNVVIKNINFINSNRTGLAGGVISWWGNNGTLENCNFTDNLASSAGGAVLWKGNFGSITNCNFINNTAVTGAAVSLTDGEGFNPSQPHIMTVNSDGGALYLSGNNISVDYCNFINNRANFNGGAIKISWGNNITVSNSRFKNNKAEHSGGAISWNGDNATLINSKFIGNAPNDLFLNSHNVTLNNSRFENESCIESWYEVNCTNVTFGPIDTFDDLASLINSTPEGDVLVLDDDYRFINGSNTGILISKSIIIDGAGHTLDGNRLSRIFNITADNVIVRNINFINGDAIGSYVHTYGGGAVYWQGANGTLENCSFTNNRPYSLEIPKEEITTDEGSTVTVYYAVLMDTKSSEGGAIVWNGSNGTVMNCIFRDNSVDYSNLGGAIYWRGNNGKVINSEFYQNSASLGAAIYWQGDNGTLASSILLNEYEDMRNPHEDELLCWVGNNATIINSLLVDAVINCTNVTCDYNCWGDTIDDPNMVFKPNGTNNWILLNLTPDKTVVTKGEEVTVSLDLTNLIDKNGQMSKYDGLKSSYKAKFIANDTGIVKLTFFYNQIIFEVVPFKYWDMNILAQKVNETPEGGLLVLDRDYIYVNGSNKGILISKSITIDGNGHTLNGNKLSRMFNISADNVVIKNINFINGNAYGKYFSNDAGGGAIYWNGANGYLENCNFTNNSGNGIEDDPFDKEETWVDENGIIYYVIRYRPMGAKTNEGGAIVWNGTKGTVFKCIFRHNGVGYPNYGGAICWRGDFGNVLESEFFVNDAWAGAAICWIGDNGTILYSKFLNTGEIFGRDIIWFGDNGLIKYSFLITSSGGNPLYPYSGNVVADYNFWGDILPNTKIDKFNNLNNWVVLNASYNQNFVKKGDVIVVKCNTLLFEKGGHLSNFSGLNIMGNITATADRDGFVHLTFKNGKLEVEIIPRTKIVSKDLTKYYKNPKKFKVRVYGADGKLAIKKYVNFTIGKKTYKVKTDKKGYAFLKINKKPGKYTVIIQYDGLKVKNKITIKSTLITKDLKKKVKKSAKFKIKVLNTKGKAFKKQLVKVKFKGKTYKLKTNKKGTATFDVPINLKVGKYKIKTTCNGLTNSNKIIVKK